MVILSPPSKQPDQPDWEQRAMFLSHLIGEFTRRIATYLQSEMEPGGTPPESMREFSAGVTMLAMTWQDAIRTWAIEQQERDANEHKG
jgi:hypothetical protein